MPRSPLTQLPSIPSPSLKNRETHPSLSLLFVVMAHAGEGKTQAKGVEGNPELLNYKTWVLRVSIHCEGCKKKVNKILHKIEGVYRTDIDLKQQRVTVTGNVQAETLISRLERKMGKHPTLLLPDKAADKAATKEKKQSKPKTKEHPKDSSKNNGNGGEDAPKDDTKAEKKTESRHLDEDARPCEERGGPGKDGAGEVKGADERDQAKEEKQPTETKQTVSVTVSPGEKSPVPEKPAAEKSGNSEEGSSGVGGRKKKLIGQTGNGVNSKEVKMGQEVCSRDEPTSSHKSSYPGPSRVDSPIWDQDPTSGSRDHVPPHQQFDTHPYSSPHAAHYYHGPPTYAVSYHTKYPMSGDGSSYYAQQPPPTSYAYAHPGQESEYAPPYWGPYSVQTSDSFGLFSDENPNACSVM